MKTEKHLRVGTCLLRELEDGDTFTDPVYKSGRYMKLNSRFGPNDEIGVANLANGEFNHWLNSTQVIKVDMVAKDI